MPRFHHPSVHDLSPGSLRVWLVVGIGLMAIVLAALKPAVELFEFRTRLSVAQQSLASFRYAVLSYCAEVRTVPPELIHPIPDKSSSDPGTTDPVPTEGPDSIRPQAVSLGEALVKSKKIDRIAFPFGEKDLLPESDPSEPLQVQQPEIWAVSLSSLAQYFKKPELFASARSSQVAILVVPFLTAKEAEGIQKTIGSMSEQKDGKTVYRGDCFFTHCSVDGKFNGWIYLSDL